MTFRFSKALVGVTALVTVAACFGGPAVNTVNRGGGTCSPFNISNDRLAGIGIDLCTDGNVYNWNGVLAGSYSSAGSDMVSITWTGGGIAGGPPTETYTSTALLCRASGTLADCA